MSNLFKKYEHLAKNVLLCYTSLKLYSERTIIDEILKLFSAHANFIFTSQLVKNTLRKCHVHTFRKVLNWQFLFNRKKNENITIYNYLHFISCLKITLCCIFYYCVIMLYFCQTIFGCIATISLIIDASKICFYYVIGKFNCA